MKVNPDEIRKALKEKQREQTRDIGEAYDDILDACKYNGLRKNPLQQLETNTYFQNMQTIAPIVRLK